MKKNIIIIISIILVLLVVVAFVFPTKAPENKTPAPKEYIDSVTDINNDLQAIDLGDVDKEFNNVNKDIQSL